MTIAGLREDDRTNRMEEKLSAVPATHRRWGKPGKNKRIYINVIRSGTYGDGHEKIGIVRAR